MKFGQRGVAIIGPSTRLAAYVIMSQHPPYPVLVLCFVLAGYGNGLEDAGWNAWVGNMQNANEVLGFLHGAYGLGGTLAPLLATSLITKVHWGWWTFYYFMFGAVATELVFASWAFWGATGQVFRDSHPNTSKGKGSRTKEALNSRIVWICAAFLLVYVGIEVSLGGWVVSFMINIRNVGNFDAGISTTGYWAGITAGRVILGFITTRIGEKEAILIYIGLALGFHLVFYFVPSIPVSFLAVALEGFFLGPLFPGAVVAATKILPPHLHVSGIGFAAAIGAAGACLLPFAVGAIAQAKGVQVLMPIVLAMFVLDAAIWYMLPSLKKKNPVDSENSSDLVESKEKKRFRMPWKKS
jgi:fucose permease